MPPGWRAFAVAAFVASSACGPVIQIPGAHIPPPTGTSNAYDAIAYATTAGLLTADMEAAKHDAQNAPLRPSYCDGDYRNTCIGGRAYSDPDPVDDRDEMTLAEARRHTLMYINGIRSLHGVGLLELDDGITEFAQDGSEQLARDHRAHGHIHDRQHQCLGCGENQSGTTGWRVEPVGRQIDEILGLMMAEGPAAGTTTISSTRDGATSASESRTLAGRCI